MISAISLLAAVLQREGGGTRIEEERATLESSNIASGTAISLPPLGVVILLPVILVISAGGGTTQQAA